ncbi:Gfo/Idh/MocA family oxidoreductase (plasmid) [Paracoccus versutus]|uniref:Dehydrogenase n=1 Tax=Paracoccus versutus TaxID=34007 RepID=A0AAQ0HI38_PARVE|nr:Gfo/Idh/MocA family oxidoreductase [Paracoccus versutus]KGJ11003.1 oxidoreductase [Paracoccus versutus]REG47033.1 putative dehydrogenase [Paracoccus versutus]WEJ82195.1 Gfo/Idh/MocA family oxidoreductase [Paracoccus versutus]
MVRLLVIGTGGMAANHARAFAAMPGVELVGGVDPRPEPLAAFNAEHGIARGFASLDEALDWGAFDAATNVTPDAAHYPTTMPLLAAGKHVLCEKPLATNAADAEAMAEAAARAGVVNMVNLSYRDVPALQKAAAMVRAGEIGEVRHFEASYLQSWLTQPGWGDWRTDPKWLWRVSTAHGSKGVLGDVGIHILDFATCIAGQDAAQVSCLLKTFDKAPGGRIGDYVLDANDSATMQIVLENGALGTVAATRFASGHLNDLRLRIYGDRGGLEVGFENRVSRLRACLSPDLETAAWHEIECPPVPTIYQRFIAAIRGEGAADPDFVRGAALQRLLDRAEESSVESGLSLAV